MPLRLWRRFRGKFGKSTTLPLRITTHSRLLRDGSAKRVGAGHGCSCEPTARENVSITGCGSIRSRGAVTVHRTPSLANARSTSPPSSAARYREINREPKPVRVGVSTDGPPCSFQTRRSIAASSVQVRLTPPSLLERLPYFDALVTSSCTAIASDRAARGESRTRGPRIEMRCRPACRCGASTSVRTS